METAIRFMIGFFIGYYGTAFIIIIWDKFKK